METTGIEILQYIFDFGATGVLAVGIYAFLRGWIISAKNFDKALEAQHEAAKQEAEIMANKICEKIETAVANGTERGIVRGYLKLNGGNK